MRRVFVAVDLKREARLELEKLIKKLVSKRWPVRWEAIGKLHITLFFIGWADEEKIDLIKELLKEAVLGFPSFKIKIGRLGVFPDFIQPRVVWLGIKGDQQELVSLQRKVEELFFKAGFETERRKWLPHLTVGRVKKEARYRAKKELGRQLNKLVTPEFLEESSVDRVVIYESKLKPTGSEYKKIMEIPLR